MQYTLRASASPEENEAKLDTASRTFQSMTRTAYNRQQENMKPTLILRQLQERYGVENWRWHQWALIEAEAMAESQRVLLPLYVEMYTDKIARVKKKLERNTDPIKKKGYEKRIRKLEQKKTLVETHIANGTTPNAVFGTRKLLEKLSKRENMRKEWQLKRTGQLFSVGQANQQGNANTRITGRKGTYLLDIRNWPGGDFTAKLTVPEYYQPLLDAALNSGEAYSVRIQHTPRNWQALISFKVDESVVQPWNQLRIPAIDINPEGLAVTITSPDGNLYASKWFPEPALVHARAEKRAWLAANLVKQVFRWLQGFGCNAVIIEKLKFGMVIEGNNNRMFSNFLRKQLAELIKMRALKTEGVCIEINPAYSSVAGELKYGWQFSHFNRHQLAAFVIGRRALGYGEHLSPEQLDRIPKRTRLYAKRVVESFYGHRHRLLKPSMRTNGRKSMLDVKGVWAFDKRVTPHTAVTSPVRLSILLSGGRHENGSWARTHRVNVPPPNLGGVANLPNVTEDTVF
jgi:hypothetical protein